MLVANSIVSPVDVIHLLLLPLTSLWSTKGLRSRFRLALTRSIFIYLKGVSLGFSTHLGVRHSYLSCICLGFIQHSSFRVGARTAAYDLTCYTCDI